MGDTISETGFRGPGSRTGGQSHAQGRAAENGSPATEDLYIESVNKTVDAYKAQLVRLRQQGDRLVLPDLDFDTGKPTRPGGVQVG